MSTIQRLECALALHGGGGVVDRAADAAGATCPDQDAALLCERDEWQAAYIPEPEKVPQTPPRLLEVVRRVALLGGFLANKGDADPGAKTLWLGL